MRQESFAKAGAYGSGYTSQRRRKRRRKAPRARPFVDDLVLVVLLVWRFILAIMGAAICVSGPIYLYNHSHKTRILVMWTITGGSLMVC